MFLYLLYIHQHCDNTWYFQSLVGQCSILQQCSHRVVLGGVIHLTLPSPAQSHLFYFYCQRVREPD